MFSLLRPLARSVGQSLACASLCSPFGRLFCRSEQSIATRRVVGEIARQAFRLYHSRVSFGKKEDDKPAKENFATRSMVFRKLSVTRKFRCLHGRCSALFRAAAFLASSTMDALAEIAHYGKFFTQTRGQICWPHALHRLVGKTFSLIWKFWARYIEY